MGGPSIFCRALFAVERTAFSQLHARFSFLLTFLCANFGQVYYREGFVRRALVPFAKGGTEAHITNSFNTLHAAESKTGKFFHHDYLWSFVDFQRHLLRRYERDNPGLSLPPHFVRDTMRPYVKQVLKFVFIAATMAKMKGGTGYLHSSYKPGTVNVWGMARQSFAEHLIATKALRCTATAWMLTVAESFAKF